LLNLKEFVSDVHFRRGLSCSGCHGGKPTDDMMSKEIGQRWPSEEARHKDRSWIPAFCARCHADPAFMRGYNPAMPTNQLEEYERSVHGKALLEKGDLGAPACNGCHGSHAAMPPAVASVAQVCRRCHAQNGILFDGSRHKTAFEEHRWPECGQCHGKHG